ncbi:MAG TPA: aminobenzoate oxygenase, partial [Stellaceae bacterium]|nr:aminobenzoate oxygenase [Stellaceae bacterium]
EAMNMFRSRIFSRIVPTVRDIGLRGPRVQQAFAAMGAMEFAGVDAAALLDNDARVADQFDARLRLRDAMPQ